MSGKFVSTIPVKHIRIISSPVVGWYWCSFSLTVGGAPLAIHYNQILNQNDHNYADT